MNLRDEANTTFVAVFASLVLPLLVTLPFLIVMNVGDERRLLTIAFVTLLLAIGAHVGYLVVHLQQLRDEVRFLSSRLERRVS